MIFNIAMGLLLAVFLYYAFWFVVAILLVASIKPEQEPKPELPAPPAPKLPRVGPAPSYR